MLNFDQKRLLIPNTNIGSTVEELRIIFVDMMPDDKRRLLFQNYLRYSDDLRSLLKGAVMRRWVDGSFVTKKKEPDDIDMVTYINGTMVDQFGRQLDPFKYPLSMNNYGIDAYIVRVFERDDRRYPLFIGDSMYWMDAFDKTQRSRNGLRYPKGFLEIIY